MSDPADDPAAPILTAAAVDRVRAIIDDSGDADLMLRIAAPADDAAPWRFSLDDTAGDADTVLDFGLLTLVLDAETNDRLQGCEIDHVDGDGSERFIVRRVDAGPG